MKPGEPYRPSNGTEGWIFENKFCSRCIHQHPNPDAGKNCEIAMRAFCFDLGEKEYPREWQYDAMGDPTCTAFVNWDWGNDGDPDDPDNPKAPPPPSDPRQLNLFPLYPTELILTPPPNEPSRSSNRSHTIHAKKETASRGSIQQKG